MKCKHCGKDLLEGAKFCVYCGKPIEVEQSKPVEDIAVASQPVNNVVEESKTISVEQPVLDQQNQVSENIPQQPLPIVNNTNEQKVTQSPIQPLENNVVQNSMPIQQEIPKIEEPTVNPIQNSNIEEKNVNAIKTNEILQPIEEVKQEPSIIDIVTPDPVIEKQPVEQNIPTPIELPKEESKNNIQQEVVTKIVKKNNPILIVIIFILLAIIIGGGIFVYTKYTANDTKSSSNQSSQTISEGTEQDYDTDKAKELIDKYYYSFTAQPDQNLFTSDMTEEVKKNIVLNNLKDEFKKIECSQINGFVTDSSGKCAKTDDATIYTEGTMIDYDTFNSKYKYLFGKSYEVSKEVFKDLTYFVSWEYIENKNVFLQTIGIGGLELTPYYSNYFVKKAETNNDELIVDVAYVYMNGGFDTDSNLKTTIAGEEVTFKESETKKDTFEQEFKDKYLDKLDTYEFIFKYEDDHYVFVDMKKI